MKLSKHRPSAAIAFNMTPMIDIVFLLIIFFMTVSQITRVADYPVPLPRVNQGDTESITATVTINLNQQGEIIVGGNPLTPAQLEAALQNQLKKSDGDPKAIKIQIRSDRNCECQHVSRLLEQLSKLGFLQVRAAVTDS